MRKLLKYMKEYRGRCALAPIFKMLEAAAELFVPLVMADIIDNDTILGSAVLLTDNNILRNVDETSCKIT